MNRLLVSRALGTRLSYGAWLLVGVLGCTGPVEESSAVRVFPTPFSTAEAPALEGNPIAPLPTSVDLDPRKVALGKRLYFDKRLSGDGLCSCNDCHDPRRGGANGEARSNLPNRAPVGVNVPTVFNAAFNFRFAWSGRFKDISEQIDTAMALKTAMNSSWEAATFKLAKDTTYKNAFAEVYPEGITDKTVREAVSIYTLSLITPNARFDRYLRGETKLSTEEAHGWEMFREYGCASCHQGINIGGNMFQKLGVVRDYFADRGNLREVDYGLFNATRVEADRFVFRVPSLRNVALTAPYFHDGSVTTLEDAVTVMAKYQLGRALPAQDVNAIASFLRTLTGELDGRPL